MSCSTAAPMISADAKSSAPRRLASVGNTRSNAVRTSVRTSALGSDAAHHHHGASDFRCLPKPRPAPLATSPSALAAATRTGAALSR